MVSSVWKDYIKKFDGHRHVNSEFIRLEMYFIFYHTIGLIFLDISTVRLLIIINFMIFIIIYLFICKI